ncbi:MAG: 2-succinyl-5-enolpyruvyl-6-hydroxy-3-cyclohexene-1-carboxylic-acid synthase [Flavobacteriales bacterium]
MISDKRTVQDLISLLVAKDVHHAVVCPGSRNAPFSISLHKHEVIRAYNIVDERSAAFFALGMAQQLQKPVAIICTSGTAALNFSPAIAEAFYQRVPLLVITADRPVEWIDQGEGQSIRQRNVYQNFVKASYEVMEETAHTDSAWHNVRIMDEAIGLCTAGVAGPVHINFPLRESLYGTAEKAENKVKVVERVKAPSALPKTIVLQLKSQLSEAKKILILAGQLLPDAMLNKALKQWSGLPQAVVMTEAHSNMADEKFITTIDRLVMKFNDDQKKFLVPDVLITVGHNIISRRIKEYLRNAECEHWHIDVSGEGLDTLKHLNKIIATEPRHFFEEVLPAGNKQSDYSKTMLAWNELKGEKANEFLATCPWSDLKAFEIIYSAIPEGHHLQMGNSSVVRYVLLFNARKNLRHFGNRGVAGIDGCTSTAIGATYASQKPTTLVTGDLGFFYDSNAFWNDYVSQHLRVIVINNGGGGIFRIIDGPGTTEALEDFFETKHMRSAEKMAEMYGLQYFCAIDQDSLEEGLTWLYANEFCSVLEVFTPRLENDKVLRAYFNNEVAN